MILQVRRVPENLPNKETRITEADHSGGAIQNTKRFRVTKVSNCHTLASHTEFMGTLICNVVTC
jgi:hypothetical protein